MSKEKSNQRFHLRSAFLGGLVAAMIVSALPAVAAQVGDALSLGESNRVNAQTILRGRAISNLTIISDARGDTNGTALDLRVRAGNPPMKVNSSDLVEGLNADFVDGLHASQFARQSDLAALTARVEALEASAVLGYYEATDVGAVPGTSLGFDAEARCDVGDKVLGGGFAWSSAADGSNRIGANGLAVIGSEPVGATVTDGEGWHVETANNSGSSFFIVAVAECADMTP
jgi:hypothetical protein